MKRHRAIRRALHKLANARVVGVHQLVWRALAEHLTIADHVHVSAASFVTRSILKPGHYTGFFPIAENREWEKNAATLKQIHRLRDRIKHLEQMLPEQDQE